MSNVLNSDLRTRKPEDFEKMVAYVTKLTSEWSLKELGYDITIPDEERIKSKDSIIRDLKYAKIH